MIETFVGFWC